MKQQLNLCESMYSEPSISELFSMFDGFSIVVIFPGFIVGCDLLLCSLDDFDENERNMTLEEFAKHTHARALWCFSDMKKKMVKK